MNNTPETHQSSSQIEALSDDERALYSIDALEQWRSHQMDDWIEHLTGELEAGKEYSEIVREYDALADKRLDTYLGGHGLVADDAPNYREVASLFRDASIEAIVAREVKKRTESKLLYEQNDRQELADDEQKELEILMTYLPKQLTEDEIQSVVDIVISELNPEGMQAMGQVIGAVKGRCGMAADGSTIARLVKETLQK